MSDSATQADPIKSVSRDFTDNVNNQTQVYFTITAGRTEATFMRADSQTTSQADIPLGDASVTNNFASGNPQTRQGPQAWLDWVIWQFTPPQPGWTVLDCGWM